jgi:hypothetical protein
MQFDFIAFICISKSINSTKKFSRIGSFGENVPLDKSRAHKFIVEPPPVNLSTACLTLYIACVDYQRYENNLHTLKERSFQILLIILG